MRVLVVSPHLPQPANSGDRVRTDQLLRSLRSIGVDATLGGFSWTEDVALDYPSKLVCARPARNQYLAWRASLALARRRDPFALYRHKQLGRALLSAIDAFEPDVVDFQHSYMWLPTEAPSICTFHNIESHRAIRDHAPARHVASIRQMEREALLGATRSVVFSHLDRKRAHELAPEVGVDVVPLGYEPAGTGRPTPVRTEMRTAIFHGSFDYEPNLGAARALVLAWPEVRAQTSLDELLIAGRHASRVPSGPGIRIMENVADMPAVLVEADVLIIPLTTGGGVRVKAIEAFAVGLPVVSTAIGVEGLGARQGCEVTLFSTPVDLPRALNELAAPEARERQARKARALWERDFTPTSMAKRMADVYRKAITAP